MRSLNQVALLRDKKKFNRRRNFFIISMLLLPLLQFAVFYVYANISSIFLSFQTKTGTWTTINYESFFYELFHGSGKGFEYRDAIIYSFSLGLNDVLLVLISTIFAYFIYKKIPGRNFFRVAFFLPSIISITIYVLVYKFLLSSETGIPSLFGIPLDFFDQNGIAIKFAIPLYCLWVGTGYNILVLGGAMANIPNEVIENARLEGVSKFRELFEIIIPMIWPTLVVAFVGSITTVFTLFIQVQLITEGAGGTKTIAYIINNLTQGEETNKAAALGIMFSVVSVPIVLVVKHLLDKLGKKWGY